jgi:Trk-type K+ transport system membrane component
VTQVDGSYVHIIELILHALMYCGGVFFLVHFDMYMDYMDKRYCNMLSSCTY